MLDPESVEAIAVRTAEILEERGLVAPAIPSLLSAAQAAARIGRSRDFIYEHADDLGAVRLGGGERPRLAFDPRRLDDWVTSRSRGGGSEAREAPATAENRGRRPRVDTGKPLDLLPIAPENGKRVTPKNGPAGVGAPRGPATRKTPSTRPERNRSRAVRAASSERSR